MKHKNVWAALLVLVVVLVVVLLLGMQTDLTLAALQNSIRLPYLVSSYSGQTGYQWLQKLNGGY